MAKKIGDIFNSFWFNVIMSVVSVVLLGSYVVANYASGNYSDNWILIVIWAVIAYYFIKKTMNKR